ncbi:MULTISPECIES: quinone oxidoreductase family protein [unclassified Rathayibacter]|uniref:quinone oxidoreductase family protein n=1 Tax=unclassified Rathayibacter TaxID=2609250 RepID=UPI0006F1F765|nr:MULTISPECIES: zinc-binding alcohol dehydrogenase family protein [unclassified Rathayibacter]KQQ00009.1 alcohol dehydrogenase [Rathayibacter sp. Leaf294]KQS09463.1 alcohol dehydrogenase [Rathayibacter sp. Leaf185]
MRAAVVTDFSTPPRCAEFRDPEPQEGFVPVRMLAVGVHRIVRSLAAGAHYGSGDELPFVPGVDGVGLLEDGTRVYTGGSPDPFGTLAERTIVPAGFAVPVPESLGSVEAAGIVNPAMSAWLPLVGAAALRPGQTVLVLGATGASGSLAVAIALHLGAGRVIAAGRNADALARLVEDDRVATVRIDDDLVASLRRAAPDGIDVVLDYLWGPVAEAALEALRRTGLAHTASATTYVQIGALAGSRVSLDASLLRASSISITGSGAGSIAPRLLLAELPKILALAATGGLTLPLRAVPLADIEREWASTERLVVTM